MVDVAFAKCASYSEREVSKAVQNAFGKLGGLNRFVRKSQRVLLKVNLLDAKKPEEGVTTHPAVVKAVALECKKLGARVFVGDSPAIASFEHAARTAGFEKACKESGARLVGLSEPVELKTRNCFAARKLFVSKRLHDFDVIINLPKLKTHTLTGFTGAVKNLYGCIPKRIKGAYHLRFPEAEVFSKMLLDLHELVRPHISLMDAVVGMQGNGPSAGGLRELGFLAASENAFALDFAALKAIGFVPEKILTVSLAEKLGLIDYKEVVFLAEGFNFPVVNDFEPASAFEGFNKLRFLLKALRPFVESKPALLSRKCVSCGSCFKACPALAIDFKTKVPKFDYNKCIRCFCCQEVCPQKAIEVRQGFLLKAFRKLSKN